MRKTWYGANEPLTVYCVLGFFFIYLKKKKSWDGQSVCKHTTTTMTLLHVLDYF